MKRRERQKMIISALRDGLIHGQSDLLAYLNRAGVKVTQATISRDLIEIGAVRGKNESGESTYSLPSIPTSHAAPMILEIQNNDQVMVLKTSPGGAQFLAGQIDREKIKGILGTIAGDDTVFIALEKPGVARKVSESIQSLVGI